MRRIGWAACTLSKRRRHGVCKPVAMQARRGCAPLTAPLRCSISELPAELVVGVGAVAAVAQQPGAVRRHKAHRRVQAHALPLGPAGGRAPGGGGASSGRKEGTQGTENACPAGTQTVLAPNMQPSCPVAWQATWNRAPLPGAPLDAAGSRAHKACWARGRVHGLAALQALIPAAAAAVSISAAGAAVAGRLGARSKGEPVPDEALVVRLDVGVGGLGVCKAGVPGARDRSPSGGKGATKVPELQAPRMPRKLQPTRHQFSGRLMPNVRCPGLAGFRTAASSGGAHRTSGPPSSCHRTAQPQALPSCPDLR